MMFFGNLGKPKDTKKSKNFNQILQENMEIERNNRDMEEFEKEIEKEMELEEAFKNSITNTRRNKVKNVIKEEIMLEEKMKHKLHINFLTEMTIRSLVLDESFIELNKSLLRDNLNNLYEESFKSEILNQEMFRESSYLMETVSDNLNLLAEKLVSNKNNINIESLLESEELFDIIFEDSKESEEVVDEVSEIVKEKVKETLEKEKEISEKNKEEETDETKDDDKDEDEVDGEDDNEVDNEEDEDDDSKDDDDDKDDSEDDDGVKNETEDDMDIDDLDDNETDEKPVKKITITTDSDNFSISSEEDDDEKSLSESLLTCSRTRSKNYNDNTFFRNLLENNLRNYTLNESFDNKINMDLILSETLIHYTILETLNTSKVLEFNKNITDTISSKLKLENEDFNIK